MLKELKGGGAELKRRRRVCTGKAEGFIWFSQMLEQRSLVLSGPQRLWSGVSDPGNKRGGGLTETAESSE